jgi:predicted acyltransferase
MKETLAASQSKSTATTSTSVFAPQRVASVDVYRGFVMLLMMAEVLSLRHVSESFPASTFWRVLYFNQDHVPWVGCSLHDLIQPSFSFLVGVALPYSIASRKSKGASFGSLLGSAIKRSLILILSWYFSTFTLGGTDIFHFRGYAEPDRSWIYFPFPAWFPSQRVQIIALIAIL